MSWFGFPCCCGCDWNQWDITSTPANFYAENSIIEGGSGWSQTGPGVGNFITYFSSGGTGQLLLGGSPATEEYSAQVTFNSFPDGDVARIWMACGDTPTGFYVEIRTGASGYIHVEGDEPHQIDYPYSLASGSVFGACIQKEPIGGSYYLTAYASGAIILSGKITPINKGAILQLQTSLQIQISEMLCQDHVDPSNSLTGCEDCGQTCGCAEACSVDIMIDGISHGFDDDGKPKGLCEWCELANGAWTLASLKGAFPGTQECPIDPPTHCFWLFLWQHYWWMWLDMTYDPTTGVTTLNGSIHLTDVCGSTCNPGCFDCPSCCGPGFPCYATDLPLCDCANHYFTKTIDTGGGPQNCSALADQDLTSVGSNSENQNPIGGPQWLSTVYNGCCMMDEATFHITGLSSINCADVVLSSSYSCQITATLDWEGVDGDGNATVDYDLYLSDSNGNVCWYDNSHAGPWVLNRDANCGTLTTTPPPETISGTLYALPPSGTPLVLKVWYNLCSVCTEGDGDIEPTVKRVVITNTGTEPIHVNGGTVMPGGTFTISSFAFDDGDCGNSTFTSGTAITLYGPS
jgi:hypothetical protein